MLLVISPAKNLDFETQINNPKHSRAELLDQSEILIDRCRQLTPVDIAQLMKISDKLSGLNAARFGEWHLPFTPDNARQAIYAFNGDVYTGIEAATLNEAEIDFAQKHLKILSGLYGLLKPLDLIQAYRLEMGTRLDNERGTNLYQFWGDLITDKLNKSLAETNSHYLINLASTEYFKSVKTKNLNAKIITPEFKDWKNGQYKMISFFAKKARGMMVRYIVKHGISDPQQIKAFDSAGYEYNESLSTDVKPVFTRKIAE